MKRKEDFFNFSGVFKPDLGHCGSTKHNYYVCIFGGLKKKIDQQTFYNDYWFGRIVNM